MPYKVAFVSLGCAKNLVNTEQMMALCRRAGYDVTGETEGADVAVLNTCGFIESAKSEAINSILELAELKKAGKLKKLLVAGCLTQRYREEIRTELPEVDGMLGTGSYTDVVTAVKELMAGERPEHFAPISQACDDGERMVTTPPYTAYLKIAEGCSNRCAYCVIPSLRGNYRSRRMEDILQEAQALADDGVQECIVIAQDITRYGMDLYGERKLPLRREDAARGVSDCKLTRKQIDKLLGDCEVQSGSKAYWFKMDENGQLAGGIAKFVTGIQEQLTQTLDLKPNTLVLVAAGAAATKSVGVLIKTFGAACEGHMDKEQYEFCWIVDFPMYEIGDESGQLEFCHNPFSMPSGGLEVLLKAERGEIDPLTITADQYDLVCNGVELSSGAVRNHDPEIMVKAFELVRLGEEDVKKKFPAMYNAFCYGAPPHAGIAPGVDRMVMLLAGESSIREIIPFPMNKNAQDIMMGAPSTVEQKQLDELHIAIVGDVEED